MCETKHNKSNTIMVNYYNNYQIILTVFYIKCNYNTQNNEL